MGRDINWVFQAQTKDGEWIDIPCKYDGERDYNLYHWLGNEITEFHGFPYDFLVDEDNRHPVVDLAVLKTYEREILSDIRGHYKYMGDGGFCWLLGSEIINARAPVEQLTIEIPIDVYNEWDKVSSPKVWHELHSNWQQMEDAELYATPENITKDTHRVIVDWEHDFTEDFRYFVDEVRRLMALHGDVRFIFGFA
jgi:hypothetical protein